LFATVPNFVNFIEDPVDRVPRAQIFAFIHQAGIYSRGA
jgi:hypothetical protein